MQDPISVLFVDHLSKATPTLRAALEHISSLKVITEAELNLDVHGSKIALVFVREPEIAKALSLINRLKVRYSTLRVVVAFQTLNGAALRRFLDAGVEAFVTHSAAPEDVCATMTAMVHGNTPAEKPARSDAAAKVLGAGMTQREVQILRLLSDGCSNKEVARYLNLSVRTVETHRLNLRRKTQTGRLHDLVALARHLGISARSNNDALEAT